MSERNFKSITDVPVVDSVPEGAGVLINDNGTARQIPAEKIIHERFFVVNITADAADDTGNIIACSADKTYTETKEAYDSGISIMFVIRININGDTMEIQTCVYNYANIPAGIIAETAVVGFIIMFFGNGSFMFTQNGVEMVN